MINMRTGELIVTAPVSRACLRCDRSFESIGKQNRLCPKCQDNAGLFNYASYPSALADQESGGISYHHKKSRKAKRS